MLLGYLENLTSTLGSMLAVTFLLQVSQQCLRPPSIWASSCFQPWGLWNC